MAKTKKEALERRKQDLCLICMECCKWIGFPCAKVFATPSFYNFYQTRGCKIIERGSFVIVALPNRCPYLSDNGCVIYERRPTNCRNYDGRKDPIVSDKCLWKDLEDA